MSAGDAVARTLVLVPWLLERPGASVADAAAAIGTTPAQVLADLDVLQYCGLPGRLGGDLFEVELVGDRILLRLAPVFERPVRPTPAEALSLVLALDTVAAALGDELPALAGAVAVLRRAAGVPAGVVATPEDGRRWLQPIRDALVTGGVLDLAYRRRGERGVRERRIEPWELVLHRGRWYLHALDVAADAHRTFRLDRVDGVDLVPGVSASSERPSELPLPAWQPGPDDVEVELAIGPGGRWLAALFDDVELLPDTDDGRERVRIATDAPRFVVDLVLAAGGAVEVLQPAGLRAQLVERARQGLDGPMGAP